MEPISVPTKFLKALAITAPKNDAREYLCGVHVEYREGYAIFVSTDGHRISVGRILYSGGSFNDFTIPSSLISKLKPHKRSDAIYLTENNFVEITNNGMVISEAMLGNFPEWRSVIPKGALSGESAIYNPQYLGDLSTIRKLLGANSGWTDLVQNGKGLSLDQIDDDFVTGIMPLRRGDLEKPAPLEFPLWCK